LHKKIFVLYEKGIILKDGSFFCDSDESKSELARELGGCLQSRNVPFGISGDSIEKRKSLGRMIP